MVLSHTPEPVGVGSPNPLGKEPAHLAPACLSPQIRNALRKEYLTNDAEITKPMGTMRGRVIRFCLSLQRSDMS